MEEVRSEDCKSESSSTSLLPLLHVLKLSRQKTGTKHFYIFYNPKFELIYSYALW